jgi:hypothetical protein
MGFGSFMKGIGHGFTSVVSAPFKLGGQVLKGGVGAVGSVVGGAGKTATSIFNGLLQAPGKMLGGAMKGLGISGTTLMLIGGGILAIVVVPRLIPKAK